jgi:hypothetical protein
MRDNISRIAVAGADAGAEGAEGAEGSSAEGADAGAAGIGAAGAGAGAGGLGTAADEAGRAAAAERSAQTIRLWRSYLPDDCVETMISMRWHESTSG